VSAKSSSQVARNRGVRAVLYAPFEQPDGGASAGAIISLQPATLVQRYYARCGC